jgi:nucleotide-binding universal stress UspA family protein
MIGQVLRRWRNGPARTQDVRKVVMNMDSAILVGVNGSPASLAALQWAADEAARRECRLRIVTICEPEQHASYAQLAGSDPKTDRLEQAWLVLTETARAVLGSGPWRNTTAEVVEGRIEQVLVSASEDADLLVLGSGPGAVVGPVVRTCLTEARCPVVVVTRRARPARAFPADPEQQEHPLGVPVAAEQRADRVPVPR